MNYDRLRDHELSRILIRDALREAIPQSHDWQSLIARLKQSRIETEFKYKGSTDQVEGVKFTIDNTTFSGSKIGKQYSYSKINALFSKKIDEQQGEEFVSYTQLHSEEQKNENKDIINDVADLLFSQDSPVQGGEVNNELPKRRKR